jgi:hypothetical protein
LSLFAGLPMSTSSLSNNSLNSSNGTFNSNSSLNSTPSADRYAALKDLDEQLREAKAQSESTPAENNNSGSLNTHKDAIILNLTYFILFAIIPQLIM